LYTLLENTPPSSHYVYLSSSISLAVTGEVVGLGSMRHGGDRHKLLLSIFLLHLFLIDFQIFSLFFA
jgi:hypothetical protein